MPAEILYALNLFGGKAIIVYVIVIVAVLAFGVYTRSNSTRR